MNKICLVILAAGMSSRFGGTPKQFAKIGPNGETLIEYSVNQALKMQFSQIHFIVGEKTEKLIKNLFGNKYMDILVTYSIQTYDKSVRSKPWGTADALTTIKGYVNTPFIICNGDDIYGSETFKICYNQLVLDENISMGFLLKDVLPESGKVNRGIFTIDKNNNMITLNETFGIEKKNVSPKMLETAMCSVNFFGFQTNIIDIIIDRNNLFKKKNKKNKNVECLLPTVINNLVNNKIINIKVFISNDKWYGVTNPGDEIIMSQQIKNDSK